MKGGGVACAAQHPLHNWACVVPAVVETWSLFCCVYEQLWLLVPKRVVIRLPPPPLLLLSAVRRLLCAHTRTRLSVVWCRV